MPHRVASFFCPNLVANYLRRVSASSATAAAITHDIEPQDSTRSITNDGHSGQYLKHSKRWPCYCTDWRDILPQAESNI